MILFSWWYILSRNRKIIWDWDINRDRDKDKDRSREKDRDKDRIIIIYKVIIVMAIHIKNIRIISNINTIKKIKYYLVKVKVEINTRSMIMKMMNKININVLI